mgnify:CR=1 FL=1|jgi:hypothetical protein|tara:strand:+ start:541 stop:1464 length:924 start_codon:yes stop_codon:yes gene_type:complete
MNKNLSQLDNLIVEILREKNLLQEQAPVAKRKEMESLPFPKLSITENWGKPGNKTPELVMSIFGKIEGNTIQAKIDYLTRFFIDECSINVCGQIDKALSGILVLDVLSSVLNDYGASSGGFLFESFMALLAQGSVESGNRNIVDFNIGGDLEDLSKSASLKLIKPTTQIKGSIALLKQALERDPNGVTYIVGMKGEDLASVRIYQITLTADNWESMTKKKDTQFIIDKKIVMSNPIAELSGLSPENLSRSARLILDSIDENIGKIYSNLKLLSDNMTKYFIDNNATAGKNAIATADLLKNTVEKVID